MSVPSHEVFKDEPLWEEPDGGAIHHVETRAESPKSGRGDSERWHSSSVSSSTRSTGNADSTGSRGRRMRPSITSTSASLATVRERDQNRAENRRGLSSLSAPSVIAGDYNRPISSPGMSSISSEKRLSLAKSQSEEIVVSSKKVTFAHRLPFSDPNKSAL